MDNKSEYLSYWIRRFLTEYAVSVRNLSRNTLMSYRDTYRMLLPFLADKAKKKEDKIHYNELTATNVQDFLIHLESSRKISVASRNQRLSSIIAFAKYLSFKIPEYVELYRQMKLIPKKKHQKPMIDYLEKEEMEALLNAPDKTSQQGYRDYVIILFMYNTGARADEVSKLTVKDLDLSNQVVVLHGKGNKTRRCPLWKSTCQELKKVVNNLGKQDNVFQNRRKTTLTRFGIYGLITKYAQMASTVRPSISRKNITPHVIRHTTATLLLQSGVDINTIRAWLGHVSIDTTNVYAEVSMKSKAEALDFCEVTSKSTRKDWKTDDGIMAFLENLYK